MKKLKIMLMSFSILAVVGGALAFNALGTTPYCTTFTNPNEAQYLCRFSGIITTCPVIAIGKLGNGSDPFFCNAKDDDGTHDCKRNGGEWLLCDETTAPITMD